MSYYMQKTIFPSLKHLPLIRSFSLSGPSSNMYWNDRSTPGEPKFEKVLISNRGEIACRIIQTLKRQGIKSVAVYSEADSAAKHVRMADESLYIGPSPINQSYLLFERIIDVCKLTGADGVHPGYGLLSENMEFCKALDAEGITFIGPNSKAIRAMGDKIESKLVAEKAKVNCIPGFSGEIENADHAVDIARKIGYPVMIKASAGGGGKGMRVSWNDEETRNNYRMCKQEARTLFLDDRLLIEKYITSQRHIEVQVIADSHGNYIHLNERECSIQRRNQKVIEEAPSSFIDSEMRHKMGEEAIALARAVGYTSAGTCEFLVDAQRNFYFLEMNTRLQVEHPITECITGIDIVNQMLRVAKGNKLLHKQSDVPVSGWAMESRVYAEDPYKSFGMPSIGRLYKYKEPVGIPNVRCDSGISEGSEISVYYDAMISKLISYGNTREEAVTTMQKALDSYVICGVTHNLSLLSDIMADEKFKSGDTTTNYLNEAYPEGFKGRRLTKQESLSAVAVASALKWQSLCRAYSGQDTLQTAQFSVKMEDGLDYSVSVQKGQESYVVSVDGKTVDVECELHGDVITPARVDGKNEVYQLLAMEVEGSLELQYKGTRIKMEVVERRFANLSKYMKERPVEVASKSVKCPMPGLLRQVSVEIGQLVNKGMEICVVESMKMQNSLKADHDGKVKRVMFKSGDSVNENEVIVEIE